MAGRSVRLLPPLFLVPGVILFGVAMLVLGIEASGDDPLPLDASGMTQANGSALLVYPIKYYGVGSTQVRVSYAFPQHNGDAYVVDCRDLEALQRGDVPARPLLAFDDLLEGRFVVSRQTLPSGYDPIPEGFERAGEGYCEGAVVFRWEIAGGDASANRPDASVSLHRTPFDAGRHWLLFVLMTAGAILVLIGGLAWAQPRAKARLPGADESPIEMLRASLESMGGQLERTRRHLLLAGVLGVFLWYPVLVPWTWRQAQRTSENPLFPWAVAGLTLVFLGVVTALWARELHRLDRELAAWRARMSELRERENTMLETL